MNTLMKFPIMTHSSGTLHLPKLKAEVQSVIRLPFNSIIHSPGPVLAFLQLLGLCDIFVFSCLLLPVFGGNATAKC